MKNGHCSVHDLLKGAGLARTPHRVSVLDLLIRSGHPLSAGDILGSIEGPRAINRVTVYRILSSFKKEGIIRELPNEQGIRYYEVACRHNPVHPHFYCRHCGKVTCLAPLTLAETWDFLSRPHEFQIEAISIQVSGSCRKCRAEKRNPVASRSTR